MQVHRCDLFGIILQVLQRACLAQQRRSLDRRHTRRRAGYAAASSTDYRSREPKDVRVLVVGCTGYIGKFVVKELIRRGFNVVAFAREQSGIGGKQKKDDTEKACFASTCLACPAACMQCACPCTCLRHAALAGLEQGSRAGQ